MTNLNNESTADDYFEKTFKLPLGELYPRAFAIFKKFSSKYSYEVTILFLHVVETQQVLQAINALEELLEKSKNKNPRFLKNKNPRKQLTAQTAENVIVNL